MKPSDLFFYSQAAKLNHGIDGENIMRKVTEERKRSSNRRNHVMRVVIMALTCGILMSCGTDNGEEGDEVNDETFDGYKIIKVGTQIWMAENLNYASKNSSCYNDNEENCEKYGRLYSFEEATKVCPPGWHLPKNSDWQTLIDYAGGYEVAGKKLKAEEGWYSNGNGTDDYSFNALPGGLQYAAGNFGGIENQGIWWSSSGDSDRFEDHFIIELGTRATLEGCGSPQNKHSIRCIKDGME